MMTFLKTTVAAAAIAGAALLSAAPASAQDVSFSFGSGGIGFSYGSGGYCDEMGCPDDFWDYPVYYCPVYFRGSWFDGPLYYREYGGEYWYWIQGNWRRDQWRGPRPDGACLDRYGPPLGFEYYDNHGFRMRDEWRNRWRRDYDRDHGNWNGREHRYNWRGRGGGNDWNSLWLRHRGNDRGGNDRGNWRGNDRGGNDHGNWRGNDRGGNDRGGNDHGGNDHGGGHNDLGKALNNLFQGLGANNGPGASHDNRGGDNRGAATGDGHRSIPVVTPNRMVNTPPPPPVGGNTGGGHRSIPVVTPNRTVNTPPPPPAGDTGSGRGGAHGGNAGGHDHGGDNKGNDNINHRHPKSAN